MVTNALDEQPRDWLKDCMSQISEISGAANEGFDLDKYRELEGRLVDLEEELEDLGNRLTILGYCNIFLFVMAAIFTIALINR